MFSKNDKTQLFAAGLAIAPPLLARSFWRTPDPTISEASAMLVGSLDDAGDLAQRLERMKGEFLAAQQRRRMRAREAAAPSDSIDDGPLLAGPADERLAAIAARP